MRTFFGSSFLLLLVCAADPAGATLRDSTQAADYLIVAPADLIASYGWIASLATWRSHQGRTAMVVATDSIWAEFGTGTPSDSSLKDFLFYVYRHWRPPRLHDVFIIGWHDVVPSHVQPDPDWDYLSDYYFATNTSTGDSIPLFNVGRLPWSPTHSPLLYNYYQKVVAYETLPESDWQWRIHVIADSTTQGYNCAAVSEACLDSLRSGYEIVRDYFDYPPDDPWHGDASTLMIHLNLGSYLVAPFAAPRFNTWGRTMPVESAYLSALRNAPRFPIACGILYDVSPDNRFALSMIPKILLSNPDGGAVAYFAQDGLAYAYTTQFRQTFFAAATSDTVQTAGDIWRVTARNWIDRIGYVNSWATGYMLLGDPGLRLPSAPAAIKPASAARPASFSLSCFPNPFNPSTRIQFYLDRASVVRLSVLNVLGQRVATLMDGYTPAGSHTIEWDGRDHPSGLYFAVLEAGSIRHVTKLMLLK